MDRIGDVVGRNPLSAIVATLAAVVLVIGIAMPESRENRENRIRADLEAGKTVEIARADDGARLWAVEREGRTIYFSKGSVAVGDEAVVR